VETQSLIQLPIASYEEEDCPLCAMAASREAGAASFALRISAVQEAAELILFEHDD